MCRELKESWIRKETKTRMVLMTDQNDADRASSRGASSRDGASSKDGGSRNVSPTHRVAGALSFALLLLFAPVLCQAQADRVSDIRLTDGGLPDQWSVSIVARGLLGPVAVAPAPDGRIYVAERLTGRILVIERGKLLAEPLVTLEAVTSGERGLLGLCADQLLVSGDAGTGGAGKGGAGTGGAGTEAILYAYHTPGLDRARITRIRVAVGDGNVAPRVLEVTSVIDDLPAGSTHNGGALAFGADRHLYFSIGDLGHPSSTLPPASRTGRIHRMTLDGAIPVDNPWRGRSEFCRGIRNCFGLTVVPGLIPTVLYLTDNGTSEHDEVNRAVAGDHLGWPEGAGILGRDDRTDPIHTWSPTTAPVGITYVESTLFPDSDAAGLLFGEYVRGRIVRLHLDDEGTAVVAAETFLERNKEPIYAVATDMVGGLWFSTGDTVGRIRPARRDWIRGDLDGSGRVDRSDLTQLLSHLVRRSDLPCPAAADLDGSGEIDYADAVTLWQFLSGDLIELPPPFPNCGDTPGNRLPCPKHPFCG